MIKQMVKIDYNNRIRGIIKKAEKYHQSFCEKNTFTGPSLHFHLRALENIDRDFDRYLEYIYATLVSWGMHKMGPKGPKMVEFEDFRASIIRIKKEIKKARRLRLEEIGKFKDEDYKLIRKIFDSIEIMRNNSVLVGNSKIMSHLLPDLIPPIDRQYTLRFFSNSNRTSLPSVPQDKEKQYELFEKLLKYAFGPISSDREFIKFAKNKIKDKKKFKWDTSIPKVIDNLIIGSFDKKL
jgi:hypothetical protein